MTFKPNMRPASKLKKRPQTPKEISLDIRLSQVTLEYSQCMRKLLKVETALKVVLDHVDYTHMACDCAEMVGAVLPKSVIQLAREALK